jgi:O-methyltransferase domain
VDPDPSCYFEDEPLAAQYLAALLDDTCQVEVIGLATESEAGLRLCAELRPDAVFPRLHGIVLDRPEVAAAAAAAAAARGLAEWTEAIGGDFFKSVPEGDLYLLRFILHDWDDADAIRILESCRRSMKPDARLVVIEAFFSEPGEQIPANMIDTQVPLFDLHLMVTVNGRELSVAEYGVLFDKVGLRTIKTTPLDNGYVMIETAVDCS